jgi:hypothetical protein
MVMKIVISKEKLEDVGNAFSRGLRDLVRLATSIKNSYRRYYKMVIPFMLLIAALVLGFIVAEGWALVRWSGWWRWLASVPLLLVSVVVLRIIVDTNTDPTSHNLWPFEVLAVIVVAGVVLGGLQLVRVFVNRSARVENN